MPIFRSLQTPDVFTIAQTVDGTPLILKNGRVPFTSEFAPLLVALTNHLSFSGGNIELLNESIDEAHGVFRKTTVARAKIQPKRLVYVMKNQRNGFFKIGISVNPDARERTLQSEEPEVAAGAHFPGLTKQKRNYMRISLRTESAGNGSN